MRIDSIKEMEADLDINRWNVQSGMEIDGECQMGEK